MSGARVFDRVGARAPLRWAWLAAMAVSVSGCTQKRGSTSMMGGDPNASSASPAVHPHATAAPAPREPPLPGEEEGDFVVKDYHFETGQTLHDVRIHFTTIGSPHRDAVGKIDNAVLLLHGTMGRGRAFFGESFRGAMFGPGQPFDLAKYYVVLPDDVGHGRSSKPSEGLHGQFPHYRYRDMVDLEHRLITEKLGIERLRLVAGTSMGGMHAWMWSEAYPDAMDGVIPIACQPAAIRGRNLVWRRMVVEATRNDPGYAGGDYTEMPHGYLAALPVFRMMVDSPAHLDRTISDVAEATRFVAGDSPGAQPPVDANDAIYALDASVDYDPEPALGRIRAKVLAINFADDQANVDSLGVLERLVPVVPGARYVVVPESPESEGHRTLMLASQWSHEVGDFMAGLPRQTMAGPPSR
jgi:homoserine O-acetyltransferase